MPQLSRRKLIEFVSALGTTAAASPLFAQLNNQAKSKVFWTPELSSRAFCDMYRLINENISG